jgi:hypothetical protein
MLAVSHLPGVTTLLGGNMDIGQTNYLVYPYYHSALDKYLTLLQQQHNSKNGGAGLGGGGGSTTSTPPPPPP